MTPPLTPQSSPPLGPVHTDHPLPAMLADSFSQTGALITPSLSLIQSTLTSLPTDTQGLSTEVWPATYPVHEAKAPMEQTPATDSGQPELISGSGQPERAYGSGESWRAYDEVEVERASEQIEPLASGEVESLPVYEKVDPPHVGQINFASTSDPTTIFNQFASALLAAAQNQEAGYQGPAITQPLKITGMLQRLPDNPLTLALQSTPEGKTALDNDQTYQVNLFLVPSQVSEYDPQTNTVLLGADLPFEQMQKKYIHEITHAWDTRTNRVVDPKRIDTPEKYAQIMLVKEAEAEAPAIRHHLRQNKYQPSNLIEKAYWNAYKDGRNKAWRNDPNPNLYPERSRKQWYEAGLQSAHEALVKALKGETVMSATGTTTYEDYYKQQWWAVRNRLVTSVIYPAPLMEEELADDETQAESAEIPPASKPSNPNLPTQLPSTSSAPVHASSSQSANPLSSTSVIESHEADTQSLEAKLAKLEKNAEEVSKSIESNNINDIVYIKKKEVEQNILNGIQSDIDEIKKKIAEIEKQLPTQLHSTSFAPVQASSSQSVTPPSSTSVIESHEADIHALELKLAKLELDAKGSLYSIESTNTEDPIYNKNGEVEQNILSRIQSDIDAIKDEIKKKKAEIEKQPPTQLHSTSSAPVDASSSQSVTPPSSTPLLDILKAQREQLEEDIEKLQVDAKNKENEINILDREWENYGILKYLYEKDLFTIKDNIRIKESYRMELENTYKTEGLTEDKARYTTFNNFLHKEDMAQLKDNLQVTSEKINILNNFQKNYKLHRRGYIMHLYDTLKVLYPIYKGNEHKESFSSQSATSVEIAQLENKIEGVKNKVEDLEKTWEESQKSLRKYQIDLDIIKGLINKKERQYSNKTDNGEFMEVIYNENSDGDYITKELRHYANSDAIYKESLSINMQYSFSGSTDAASEEGLNNIIQELRSGSYEGSDPSTLQQKLLSKAEKLKEQAETELKEFREIAPLIPQRRGCRSDLTNGSACR